jgi:hypothetical protein
MSGGGRASGRAGRSSAKAGNGGIAAFNAASLPIKGSEKQVAWAQDIIQTAFDTIDVNIKRMEEQNKKESAGFKQRHPGSKMTAELKSRITADNDAWIAAAKEYRSASAQNFSKMNEIPAKQVIDSRYNFSGEMILRSIGYNAEQKKRKK